MSVEADARQWLADNGYKIVTRREFELAADRPLGLFNRFESPHWSKALPVGAFVLYDPEDDEDGFMLTNDNVEALAIEAFKHLLDCYEGSRI